MMIRATCLSVLLGSSMLGIATVSSVQAQEAAAPSDSPAALDEIVVTAQKRAQSLQDVPVSVSVVSGEALDQANISNTMSIGQIAPSVTFTTGFGIIATSFNIRGVGSYVSELGVQPAVSVVVDGVPLARNAEFVGELGELERLEVLNGPQGTLFGRNSTGGAINVVRKLPTDSFEGSIDARLTQGKVGGTELLTKFGVGGPVVEGIRARVTGYVLDRGNYVENLAVVGRDHGQEKSWGLTGKAAFDIGDNINLLVTGEGRKYRARSGENHVLVPIAQFQQPLIPNVTATQTALLGGAVNDLFKVSQDDITESTLDSWGATADLTWRLWEGLTLRSITSYRDVKVATQPDTDSTQAAPGQTFGWDVIHVPSNLLMASPPRRRVEWNYTTQELRLEYASSALDVIGGVFYQNFEESLRNAVPLLLSARSVGQGAAVGTPAGPSASYPYYYSDALILPSDRNKTLAGFADVTAHLTDSLDIFAGYRLSRETLSYDYDRTSFFFPVQNGVNYDPNTFTPLIPGTRVVFSGKTRKTEWSGRAGARFEVTPGLSLYGTASRGYIGAGVDLSRATGGSAANPNGAFLEPSIARNFEIGFKSELMNRRLRLNGAVFDLLVKDLQAQALIPGTVNNRVQNAGDIRTRGIELTGEAVLMEALRLNGGVSYVDSEFRNFRTICYPGQTAAQGCVGGAQIIDGKVGLNAPKVKFNVGANLRLPISSNGAVFYVAPRYNYQSKVYYTLDHDPLNTQKGYGIVDLTVGVTSEDERIDVSVFARNLGNTHFCASKQSATIIARVFCQGAAYDAQRLLGVAGRFRF